MRIACPNCAAEYEVPSTSLRPYRKLRCTRCGAEWTAVREAETIQSNAPDATPPANPPPPTATAMDRLAASPPTLRPSVALRIAWVLTVLVLVGLPAAAIMWRGQVVRAWPPSAWILGSTRRDGSAQVPPMPLERPHGGKPG